MRLVHLLLAAAVAPSTWAAPAPEAAKPPLVVLDLEPKGATPLQAEAATLNVVRGLRDLDVFQVLSTADVRQLLAIERTRQLVGAESSGFAAMASSLGATNAVVGSVTRLGDKLQVELRLMDAKAAKVLAHKTVGPLANMEAVASALPGAAQELVAPLLRDQQGKLVVHTREEAAEVLVDDTLVGSTPLKEAVALPRGTHRLQVRKDGFIAQTRSVRIYPDQIAEETVTLVPSADYAEAYQQRFGRIRVGAYIATAAAVASFVGAYAIDRAVTEPTYQNEFLPRKRALDGVVPSQMTLQEQSDAAFQTKYAACAAAQTPCRDEIQRVSGQIFGLEAATVGLAVVGAAATGFASYLWVTGKDPNRYANVVAGVAPSASGPTFVLSGSF